MAGLFGIRRPERAHARKLLDLVEFSFQAQVKCCAQSNFRFSLNIGFDYQRMTTTYSAIEKRYET